MSRTFASEPSAQAWLEEQDAADGKIRTRTSYRVRYRDRGGDKWKSKTFAKLKDAKCWLEEAHGRKRRNKPVEASRELLKDYLERWLKADVEGGDLRRNTAAQYRWNLEAYIIPHVGDTPLRDLTVSDLKERYATMRSEGLSKRTVQLTNAVLSAALADAETEGLLLFNPAASAIKRRRRGRNAQEETGSGNGHPRKTKAMLPEEAAAFLEAAKDETHETLFTFLLLTGCRPSEAFAMRWADVDLESGEATVSRSLCRVGRSWSIEATKTSTGERAVPLAIPLLELLRKHRAIVGERRLKAGSDWHDHDLVFPGPAGEPLDISAVRRRHFNKICALAGLADVEELPAPERRGKRGPKPKPRQRIRPWFTLYSLRHTAASLHARLGTPPKVVASILGHSDISTTLRHYTHSAPDLERKAVAELAAIVNIKL